MYSVVFVVLKNLSISSRVLKKIYQITTPLNKKRSQIYKVRTLEQFYVSKIDVSPYFELNPNLSRMGAHKNYSYTNTKLTFELPSFWWIGYQKTTEVSQLEERANISMQTLACSFQCYQMSKKPKWSFWGEKCHFANSFYI